MILLFRLLTQPQDFPLYVAHALLSSPILFSITLTTSPLRKMKLNNGLFWNSRDDFALVSYGDVTILRAKFPFFINCWRHFLDPVMMSRGWDSDTRKRADNSTQAVSSQLLSFFSSKLKFVHRGTCHYTKNITIILFLKIRRIWCEDCRVVQMQFKQTNGKWE